MRLGREYGTRVGRRQLLDCRGTCSGRSSETDVSSAGPTDSLSVYASRVVSSQRNVNWPYIFNSIALYHLHLPLLLSPLFLFPFLPLPSFSFPPTLPAFSILHFPAVPSFPLLYPSFASPSPIVCFFVYYFWSRESGIYLSCFGLLPLFYFILLCFITGFTWFYK